MYAGIGIVHSPSFSVLSYVVFVRLERHRHLQERWKWRSMLLQ